MAIYDPSITNDPLCQCGRSLNKIHCPKCGSHDCYARSSLTTGVLQDNGTVVDMPTIRCKRCATHFNKSTKCEAPTFITHAMLRKQKSEYLLNKIKNGVALQPEEKKNFKKLTGMDLIEALASFANTGVIKVGGTTDEILTEVENDFKPPQQKQIRKLGQTQKQGA